MHVRRHNKQAQNAVYATQHAHIAVINMEVAFSATSKYDYTQYRRPQHDNPDRFDEHGEQYFYGVESNSCSMTGDCHVRFCERLGGETPPCLLGTFAVGKTLTSKIMWI